VELREKYRKSALALTMEVMQFLKNWRANHIMGQDRQYAAEL
jgi:hemerythrin